MHKQFLMGLTALFFAMAVVVWWVWHKADAAPSAALPSPVQRCMNLSGALEAPSEGLWGYTVRKQDLQRLKEAGFDTVRLPVRWQLSDGLAGIEIDPDQLARVDEVLRQAEAADLQVILNAHHYNALNEDPDTHEPRLEALWRTLAAHYSDAPSNLIFEFINEPHSKMSVTRTDALNGRLLAIIRETHPDRWVLFGTAHWGALEGLLKSDPPHDPKAIIGFHYYEPFKFTHQGAFFVDPPLPVGVEWGSETERAAITRDFARAAQFRDRAGMPLLLGEFGVYEEIPLSRRADWTRTVRLAAEDAGFGWCHWGFATTFKSYDIGAEAWLTPMLDALIP